VARLPAARRAVLAFRRAARHNKAMKQVLLLSCLLVLATTALVRGRGDEPPIRQDRRYLAVKNDTTEKLIVFVQYNTWAARTMAWTWFPSEPKAGDAVAYVLRPGQQLDLEHEEWPVNARCVRIWARAENGDEYNEYKDQDLWLVERQPDGERYYLAPRGETFLFTFSD
jgi:hypothetical protein